MLKVNEAKKRGMNRDEQSAGRGLRGCCTRQIHVSPQHMAATLSGVNINAFTENTLEEHTRKGAWARLRHVINRIAAV